jgi:hypothetical protein
MSPSPKTTASPKDPNVLLTLMDDWPKSWAGTADDIPIGEGLVALMRPFIIQLHTLHLSAKTIRRHLDNLWVIGGEIIREVNHQPKLSKKTPQNLLCEAVADGEASYVRDASESEQRSLDTTARKLQSYLISTYLF